MSEVDLDDRDVLPVSEIIRRLPKFFTISIASRRNSGKSHLSSQLVKLLIRKKKVDIVIVMSGSAGLNNDWNFVNSKLVMAYSDDMLTNIWNKQESDVLNTKMKAKHVLVVLDDCLSTPEAIRSPVIGEYYTRGRHLHVSMICISQHTSQLLTPIMRANSDIILWSKLNRQQLEQLWLSTTNITKADFIRVSEALGGHDYNFMLLDNIIQNSRDPADFLSIVRANP